MMPATFGEYVAVARGEHGYSVRQLAGRLGVAPSTVTRIENGSLALPVPDLFIRLIDELDLTWSTALDLVGPYGRLWQEMTRRAYRQYGHSLAEHVGLGEGS